MERVKGRGENAFGLRREAKRHAAFVRTKVLLSSITHPARESGVAAALCHRSPKFPQNAVELHDGIPQKNKTSGA